MLLTPTYYIHQMYLPFQDATLLPVAFDAGEYRRGDIVLPRVDAVAARATDGKLWLSLVNLDPSRPADVRVAIPGVRASAAAGTVLTAPRVNAINSFEAPNTVVPRPITGRATGGAIDLQLPAASVVMMAIEE
jgi:alpha-N-arabinofuranosidase